MRGGSKGNEKIIGTIERGNEMLGEKIDGIKEDTSVIRDSLSVLTEIYHETLELREKYEKLSMDVEAIKMKIK